MSDKMLNDSKSTPEVSISHEEYNDVQIQEVMEHKLEYDTNGLLGIIRSPYVFGASCLASFGGFSFGYGMNLNRGPQLLVGSV
jgi:hypothetical protein